MKVLVISPKFHPVIGGGETYVLNSVKQLHQAGIDVSIAVEPNAQRNTSNYPYPVFEIVGLSDDALDVTKATAGLHKLIESVQPDVIHVHGYYALLIIGLCGYHDIPVVASVHSTPVWGERIVGGMNSFEAELQFARGVLDVSRPAILTAANKVYSDAAKKIAQHRVAVKTMPYPVDIGHFYDQTDQKMRTEFGLGDKDILVMTPSRIIERKGIKEAVLALAKLPDNFYLCLPGAFEPLDKDYWESVVSCPEYKRVTKRIIVPNRKLLYDDMPYLYAASDIIAMPSYYEGAPVATVEAMASGKPFVGADSQGINSFIRHQENGLLVPAKSTAQLADAILAISQNSPLQQQLTSQALKDIQYLSWSTQLAAIIAMYQRAIILKQPAEQLVEVS